MKNLPLKEVMVKDPITLNIDDSLNSAAQTFQQKNIRHLPVVNSQGVILGILSQRDLNSVASPQRGPDGGFSYDASKLAQYILKQHVIQKVITLSPEDTLDKALELMTDKKIGCIPIVDSDDRVVGIVTVIDMLKLFLETLRSKN